MSSNSDYTSGVKYKTKTQDWTTYTDGKSIQLTNVGDWVQFKNTDINPENLLNSRYPIGWFKMSGLIDGSGNIQSLLNFVDYCTPYCYDGMFFECESLTVAPELPATSLAPYCYNGMFFECESLTVAPELPATTLAESCYSRMFEGCTSLSSAPELPAKELANSCYENMFTHCTSLSSINVGFTDWHSSNNSTYNWVGNVAETGTFVCPKELVYNDDGTSDPTFNNSHIPEGWAVKTE